MKKIEMGVLVVLSTACSVLLYEGFLAVGHFLVTNWGK